MMQRERLPEQGVIQACTLVAESNSAESQKYSERTSWSLTLPGEAEFVQNTNLLLHIPCALKLVNPLRGWQKAAF